MTVSGTEVHLKMKNVIHKVYTQYNQKTPPVTDEEPPDKFYLQLPFTNSNKKTNNFINNINQKLSSVNITPVYTCNKTKHLFKTKSVDIDAVRSSIVYKYTCETCQKVYFGATDRHFSTRQSEHMKGKNNSEIVYHTHAPKKTNFEVLGKFNYPFIAETLYISMADINRFLNTQIRSYELKLFLPW